MQDLSPSVKFKILFQIETVKYNYVQNSITLMLGSILGIVLFEVL